VSQWLESRFRLFSKTAFLIPVEYQNRGDDEATNQ